jgi:hypothetical protein
MKLAKSRSNTDRRTTDQDRPVNALHDPDEGVPAGSSMATESAVRGGAGSTESTLGATGAEP